MLFVWQHYRDFFHVCTYMCLHDYWKCFCVDFCDDSWKSGCLRLPLVWKCACFVCTGSRLLCVDQQQHHIPWSVLWSRAHLYTRALTHSFFFFFCFVLPLCFCGLLERKRKHHRRRTDLKWVKNLEKFKQYLPHVVSTKNITRAWFFGLKEQPSLKSVILCVDTVYSYKYLPMNVLS